MEKDVFNTYAAEATASWSEKQQLHEIKPLKHATLKI